MLIFAGRAHLYQGFSAQQVTTNVRLAHAAGARAIVLTNAAGALDSSFGIGDLMLITDHINLTGTSPLVGPNDETLGPRFPDMTHAYDPDFRRFVAEDPALRLHEVGKRPTIERDEGSEIDDGREQHEARGEMSVSEIWPQIGPVPVIRVAVGKLSSPSLHQADRCDNDDAGREHEQSAPFARGRKAARPAAQDDVRLAHRPLTARGSAPARRAGSPGT